MVPKISKNLHSTPLRPYKMNFLIRYICKGGRICQIMKAVFCIFYCLLVNCEPNWSIQWDTKSAISSQLFRQVSSFVYFVSLFYFESQ